MSDDELIKVCIDRILPEDMMVSAAKTAIEVNPSNQPTVTFSPGLGIAPMGLMELAALTAKKWDNGRVLHVLFLDGDPLVQERCSLLPTNGASMPISALSLTMIPMLKSAFHFNPKDRGPIWAPML